MEKLNIATATSRLARKWRNKSVDWDAFVQKCARPVRTNETVAEYARMSHEEQSSIKDVGGFVGAYLNDGVRKTANVAYRTMATLDVDNGVAEFWSNFIAQYGCAALLYSTHKHTKESPRYRLVIPFSRRVSNDEYEPICRRIAASLGIDCFDHTTYQLARLFYWPSVSQDGEYAFQVQDGGPLDPDSILATYDNPFDASSWPIGSAESDIVQRTIKQAGDPLAKPGLIGAFCRAYTIEDVIEQFLDEIYEPTAVDGRYTYRLGSVAGGLVCYEHKFAYSHHDTDPASMQLCNAFDLVRVHLYGHLDEGRLPEDVTQRKSYKAMMDFAGEDKQVHRLLRREREQSSALDFASVESSVADADDAWADKLQTDKKGNVKSTAPNIVTILENHPAFRGHLFVDEFSTFRFVRGGLPWNPKATSWTSSDASNLRVWLEDKYGIRGKDLINDAAETVFSAHAVHPIRDYLNSLSWDGTPRVDNLLHDYLGAEESALSSAMIRKHLVAAVARVMHPGIKYDQCLIITGTEGIGKSTLFSILAGRWFSDSLITMEGKQAMEQIRGAWIIELSELGSVKRSAVEQVKAFISRCDDIYRPAYGTVIESHPRQCIFCGTTNEDYFLKGDTGNRRFWVVRAGSVSSFSHKQLADNRDQIWAEAVHYFNAGEKLYLDEDYDRAARERQKEYNDNADDGLRELLMQFLDRKIPVDWPSYSIRRRRAWLENPDPLDAEGIAIRDRFCPAEFICEQIGLDPASAERKYMTRKVNKLMLSIPGWGNPRNSRHVETLYGVQRTYFRLDSIHAEDDDL